MGKNMKNLAVIPARSGSKGLADKNIRLLNQKPLLAYSVEAAKASQIFDEIYVSTDSEKYAEIAVEYGAKVPFLRSRENASDTASSWDVVKEAIRKYEENGMQFDMVTLLQPTTPFRTPEDILAAYKIYTDRKANSVVSVCETDHSPLWCNTLPEDHSMGSFIRWDVVNQPRQKLNTYYRINGAVYMVDVQYLKKCSNIYESKSIASIMDRKHSLDIDDAFDFMIAEAMVGNI
jgi:CMP-N,N'-diacetyllegionaminic acid synthase